MTTPPIVGGVGERGSLVRRALAWALGWVVRALVSTLRVVLVDPELPSARPTVYAFLHGRQVGLLGYPRPRRVAVLASLSRDGDLQTRILSSLGFEVVRGSSSRGADAGLVALVRAVRGGASAAVAVDGPRGPRGVVKPGALFVARAAGGAVVPVSYAASRCLRLTRSWDHFVIPAPWSRVVVVRGTPIEVTLDRATEAVAGEERLEAARQRLERELTELTERAEGLARSGNRGVSRRPSPLSAPDGEEAGG